MCTILLTFADKLLDIFLAPSPRRPYWEAPQTPTPSIQGMWILVSFKKIGRFYYSEKLFFCISIWQKMCKILLIFTANWNIVLEASTKPYPFYRSFRPLTPEHFYTPGLWGSRANSKRRGRGPHVGLAGTPNLPFSSCPCLQNVTSSPTTASHCVQRL